MNLFKTKNIDLQVKDIDPAGRRVKIALSKFNNVDSDNMKDKQNCTGQKWINCLLCYTHNKTKHIVEAVKINGRAINR